MDYRAAWTYARLSQDRIDLLNSSPFFRKIVERLVDEVDVGKSEFTIDRGRTFPVDGALRPVWFVSFDPSLVDWFFNGPCGYRAQYYSSPENGLNANSFLLRETEQKLVQIAKRSDFEYMDPDHGRLHMDRDTLQTSLRQGSAKVWGDESKGELNDVISGGQNSEPQILAERWMVNADANAQKALWGIQAPIIETLKFHGAFLKNGIEIVPPNKIHRSEDIYYFGFS
jgi:hypothetical protein